ncbi:MAG: protein kinase domain-containing protein [Planctomycetota bacterium]
MRIGPYDIIAELGKGGMGVVYRARRPDLDRDFALKVVPPSALGSPQAVARLRREAQAAARLATVEGVVGVHDVGEDDGQVYIAMDLIDGKPFDHLIDDGDLTPWQSTEIVTAAARAVHAAHELGVLHRDLKPANILVDRASVAFVADFGLAKVTAPDADVTRLTKSGELLGTPAYMPPEQVRGNAIDARADVYALGATLYEALGGRPPFHGESVHGVLRRVLDEDPPSLRALDGRIPVALEAVVVRALAKQPADRYPSAAALADDLERFLRGEAVEAKLPSRAERWRRRARRHQGALLALGVAIVALGATVVVMIDTAREKAVIERTTEALSASELAGRLSASYLLLAQGAVEPMGVLEDHWHGVPVPPERVAAALERVRATVARASAAHAGPRLPGAWLALAEAFTGNVDDFAAINDVIDGLEAQGTDDPFPRMVAARLALARVAHGVDLPRVGLGPGGIRVPDYTESDEVRRLRERAESLMASVVDHPVWAELDQGPQYRDFARAARLFGEGDYAGATVLLTPLAEDPVLQRAAIPMLGLSAFFAKQHRVAAETWERPSVASWPTIRRNAALARLGYAERVRLDGDDPEPHYRRAIASADSVLQGRRGDSMTLTLRAHGRYRLAEWLMERRRDGGERLVAEARADYELILRQQPANAGAGNGLGLAWSMQARLDQAAGRDPRPAMEAAAAAFERVSSDTGQGAVALSNLASALRELAMRDRTVGADPLPLLQQAIQAADRALQAEATYVEAASNRGRARLEVARVQRGRGNPAEATVLQAIADFTICIDGRPEYLDAAMLRGDAYRELAELQAARGEDPESSYQLSEESLARVLDAEPKHVESLFVRGMVRVSHAEWLAPRDRNRAGAVRRSALADLDRALELNPNHTGARNTRGNLRKLGAQAAAARGEDPRPLLTAAIADFDQLLRESPGFGAGYVNRGIAHGVRATDAFGRGADPTLHEDSAIADYDRAVKLNPRNWIAFYNRAQLYANRGGRVLARSRDPRRWHRAAAADYTRVCELRPAHADAWLNLSAQYGSIAKVERALKVPATETMQREFDVLNRAIERFPSDLRFYTNRANTLRQMGDDLAAAGADGSERWQAALRDTDLLLEQPSVVWQTHTIRGVILERLGRLEEAIAAHETAVKVSGGQQTPKNYLAIARKKLGR